MRPKFLSSAVLQALITNAIKPIEVSRTNISDSPFISRKVPPPQRKRPYVQKLVPNLTQEQKDWNAAIDAKKKRRR